jgi:hypothetical protein
MELLPGPASPNHLPMPSVMVHPGAAGRRSAGRSAPRRPELAALVAGLLLAASMVGAAPAQAVSALLESVKQNPALARSLCEQFKQRNAAGQSAMAKDSIAQVAASQGLNSVDAEVLTTYVIGLYCPDVR